MKEYHKIHTVFKRDPKTKFKTLLSEYSLPEFEYLKNNVWIFTEKVDGTNIRVMYQEGRIVFGGKTERAQIPARLVTYLNDTFLPLTDATKGMFSDGVCLYGEGYGAKIQKGGGNYRPDNSFVLFDVRVGNWWLKREDVEDIADKLGIDVVPIIGTGTLEELTDLIARGFESAWGPFMAEGIVARPQLDLMARNGDRIITKLKHKDFINAGLKKERPSKITPEEIDEALKRGAKELRKQLKTVFTLGAENRNLILD